MCSMCPMMFCCCSEWHVYQYVDTQAREVKAGCMITLDLFREQQKWENIKEATLQRLESKISPLPTLSPENGPDGGAQLLSPKSDSRSLSENDTGRNQNLILNTKSDSSSTPLTSKGKGNAHKTQVASTFYLLLCSF